MAALTIASCGSTPAFSHIALGIIRRASLKALTPKTFFPSTLLEYSFNISEHAISNDAAPGNTPSSSNTFFTALKPSRIASLTCAIE